MIREDSVPVYTRGNFEASLLQNIRDLKAAVHRIEAHLGIGCEAIVLRELSDTEARAEILTAFHAADAEPLYYDDVSERLRLPIEQVARLCDALIAEGVLGEKQTDER